MSLPVVDVYSIFDIFLIPVHGVTSHPPTVRSGSAVGESFCHLTWRNLNCRLPPALAVDSLWTHKNSDANGFASSGTFRGQPTGIPCAPSRSIITVGHTGFKKILDLSSKQISEMIRFLPMLTFEKAREDSEAHEEFTHWTNDHFWGPDRNVYSPDFITSSPSLFPSSSFFRGNYVEKQAKHEQV